MLARSEFIMKTASAMTWSAIAMGFIGLMVRWYESYLIGADVGHIPVSNLYEVFVLFCLITAMMYLYYEARYQTRQTGGLRAAGDFGCGRFHPLVHLRSSAPTKSSHWCRRLNPGG